MMARVRGVMSASTVVGSSSIVPGSGSARTGVQPLAETASTVAMKVFAGTITSSPGPRPRARRISDSASSPLPTPTAWRVPQNRANSVSNASVCGPRIVSPEFRTA